MLFAPYGQVPHLQKQDNAEISGELRLANPQSAQKKKKSRRRRDKRAFGLHADSGEQKQGRERRGEMVFRPTAAALQRPIDAAELRNARKQTASKTNIHQNQ
jgi:hypothetical protein